MSVPTTQPPPQGRNVDAQQETSLSGSGSEKAVIDEKGDHSSPSNHNDNGTVVPGAKRELTARECESELAFAYPESKKWWILTVIFLVQTSMNFNTSLYSNGLGGISEEFGVSEQVARLGAALFLILYAFGCELWAPWSEEFGRKPIMQASLFLVNIWTLPVALAPNFASLIVGRCLGGLSSAGGSVTLGMIADMFDSDHQQYAVAYIVFSSVGGSILGPIVGGFVQQFLPWRWCIWIQLIFGGFVQILHLITVPETRTTIMIDHIAKKRRKNGEDVWGPNEIESFRDRFTWNELMHTWTRPFSMFLTEPIVLVLSLLSGFADALIFMQIQSFSLVYTQWGFNDYDIGLAFIPIGIGYVVAWLSFIPAIKRNTHQRRSRPDDEHAQYESRLWWLLFLAPCLPLGLFIFAFTCNGPPIHWVGSMVASGIIGIANYAIYMATIDYMICAYGPYSASATGGNGWARDFLAGVLTCAATPFYENIPGQNGKPLFNASIILFCISFLLVIAVYVIYWKGPVLRKRSPFAESLAKGVDTERQRRPSTAGGAQPEKPVGQGAMTPGGTHRAQRPHFGAGSRTSSYTAAKDAASRNQSRHASRAASRAHSFEEERDGENNPYASPPSGKRTPGSRTPGTRTPRTAGASAEHVHPHQLHSRLAPLAKIESEQP
ncbi:hypothetical protein N8I77_003439 [Diaporthe amygdali]|uniref:Major facilitator superfamily (MFS) profile domain-containing protein n=1 Tax=Phomopsis amygdali TaxID=1214568 RepID=A0AAD9SI00_PHOAM|nr:hypothetical protein N8I77_003439 [Diaporthe amygdali]